MSETSEAEERLYGLLEVAERQQAALDGLAGNGRRWKASGPGWRVR